MARPPDIEIAATVRAGELRFACEPETRVCAHSNWPATVAWISARENLPDEVEPGVTYRDVAVTWGVAIRLDESASP